MHATSSTYTSPETPTCEVPSNGVVEISLLPVCTGETSIYTRSSYPKAVSTLHCALENGADLHVNDRQKVRYSRATSTEERRRIMEPVDEGDAPLTQYITNAGITRARYTITHFKHHHRVTVLRLISNRMSAI